MANDRTNFPLRNANQTDSPGTRQIVSNMTLRQYRVWLEQSLSPDLNLRHFFRALYLPDDLAPHLETAWNYLAAAADATRARLEVIDGTPFLRFTDTWEPLHRAVLPPGDPAARITEWAKPAWTKFHAGDLLHRHALIRCSNGQHIWAMTASHLVCDGRSQDIIQKHMLAAMESLARGESLPPLSLPSFEANMARDLLAEGSNNHESARKAWEDWMAERRKPFSLFGRQIRHATRSKGRVVTILSKAVVDRLTQTAGLPEWYYRSVDVTLANFFLAFIAIWIWRHGGPSSFVVGVPFHGRAAAESDLVGFKSEILPVFLEFNPDTPFNEFLKSVHEVASQSLKHRGLSIANPTYAPNYHVVSNYSYLRELARTKRRSLQRMEINTFGDSAEAIDFLQTTSVDLPDSMRCVLTIDSTFLELTESERIQAGWRRAMEFLLANPVAPIKDVPFIDAGSAELFDRRALPEVGCSGIDWLGRWIESLGSVGSATAVVHGNEELSHRELHDSASRWLTCLRTQGIKSGDLVIVWSPSSNALSAAYLAIASSGAIYVPIHSSTPLTDVIETAHRLGSRLVLCTPGRESEFNIDGVQALPLHHNTVKACLPGTLTDPDPDAVTHIFHTSGSTGVAKPIAVSHRALAALIRSWIDTNALQPGERIFHFYSITFDPWLSGLLPALWLGGCCIVSDQGKPPSGEELPKLLTRHAITTLCTPTAYFHALCDLRLPPHVDRWIVGGEALAADKAQRFLNSQDSLRSTKLINAYGPTETTLWASVLEVSRGHADSVPVGKPLPTCGFMVCDDWGNPAPFGVPGELWISGAQVAEGYVGQPDLTAAQFVEQNGQRWYKTGDIVRWRKDGDLDFLGRKDRQVQIRGYRVEPGEIEVALRKLDTIQEAVVLPIKLKTTTALCAYVIARDIGASLDPLHLRSELLRTLPEYKVPKWILPVESFPKNGNGKIDMSALPPPNTEREGTALDRLPTLTLWDLRLVFEEILGLPRVNLEDDFFDLGGDSLLLVELLVAIEKRFGKTLEPIQIIQHPTIGGLAPLLEEERSKKGNLVVEMKVGTRAPLFCIPGAGGIGVEFYPLSRRLPEDQPLVVLRSSGTDGHSHPPATLEALLEEHIVHILAHRRTHGEKHPVHLAGYSLGGIFAYEVAQRLKSRGIPVGHLFIIDSHLATTEGRALSHTATPSISQSIRKQLRSLFEYAPKQKKDERAQLADQLERAVREDRIMEASALGRYNLLVQAGFFKEISSAPGQFNATFFLASMGPHKEHARLWQELVQGLVIEQIDGRHDGDDSIVREPRVTRLAQIVAERLTNESSVQLQSTGV